MNDGPTTPAKEVWRAVLGELELQLPKATFETWLKQTDGVQYDDTRFLVQVPTAFAIAWLERTYHTIQKTVEKVTGQPLEVQFQVTPQQDSAPPMEAVSLNAAGSPTPRAAEDTAQSAPRTPLPTFASNPKYTFHSFVVGSSNRLAYSAAQAVADAPGQSYNPLFLYSGVGLGKTHLLYAIGQACARNRLSILYVSSEQFTNDFVSSIRNRTTEEFRDRYRSAQVLLVDDVQFMGGKDQTQEVFFHTFNDLHNAGHQIVLTSDRPPQTLALLEDRLRSRFAWGLIADIQPPDLETRMAILAAKADEWQVRVDESIIELIAKRVQKNVRELEGSLNRVVAYSKLMGEPIALNSTSRILDELTADTARHAIDPTRIIEEVSRHYRVSNEELLGRSRRQNVAQARQVSMYLLMYELGMSPTDVGRLLGDRHHSTVIHGAGKINGEINEDSQLRQDVLTIKEAIFT